MTFKNTISGPIFCADAPDIVISASTSETIDVNVSISGETWPLSISPVPASEGFTATIKTKEILEALIEPLSISIGSCTAPQVTITAGNDTEGSISMSFQALYGSAGGKTPAEMFRHWFTWRDQISSTTVSAREVMTFVTGLSLLGWASGRYSVNVKVYTSTGPIQKVLASGAIPASPTYIRVSASYADVLAKAGVGSCLAYDLSFSLSGADSTGSSVTAASYPLRLVVAVGDTRIREFVFVNSLGVEDRVIAYGIGKRDLDGGSTKFINNGIERENGNDAQSRFEVYSGNLSTARSVEMWLDFLKSSKRYLSSSGLELIVIDEYDTSIQEGRLGSVSFKYRLGERREGSHYDDSESIGDYDPDQKYGALVVGDLPASTTPAAEDLFFLKTRLDEFPLVSLSEDYLLLVQSPVSYHWGSASLDSIKEWLQKEVDYDGISLATVWKSLSKIVMDAYADALIHPDHIPVLDQSKIDGLKSDLASKADLAEGVVPKSELPSDTAFFIAFDINRETLPDGSYRMEVSHNMGRRPTVTVTDADGNAVFLDVKHADDNTVTLTWSGDPLAGGKVYLV